MLCHINRSIGSVTLPFIYKFEVDKGRQYTPRTVMRSKGQIKIIFSDHCSTKVELGGIPKRRINRQTKHKVCPYSINILWSGSFMH